MLIEKKTRHFTLFLIGILNSITIFLSLSLINDSINDFFFIIFEKVISLALFLKKNTQKNHRFIIFEKVTNNNFFFILKSISP